MRWLKAYWLMVAGLVWVGAVGWHWLWKLPLQPNRIHDLGSGRFWEGIGRDGSLIVSRDSGLQMQDGTKVRRGPVEFLELPEFTKVREVFSGEDVVTPCFDREDGRCILFRSEALVLANLMTGESISELPGLPSAPVSGAWVRGDRLVAIINQVVWVYDLGAKRVVSESMGGTRVREVAERFAVITQNLPQPNGSFQWTQRVLNLSTGRIDPRFEATGGALVISPDEGRVVKAIGPSIEVYDFETAGQLWSTPAPVQYFSVRFESPEVLTIDLADQHGSFQGARWDAADGTVLTAAPVPSSANCVRQPLKGTRYATEWVSVPKPEWRYAVESFFVDCRRALGISTERALSSEERMSLVEIGTGRLVRPLARKWLRVEPRLDGRGFVACEEDFRNQSPLMLYGLPPSRDWGWFLCWGLGPAVGVFVIVRRLRRGESWRV